MGGSYAHVEDEKIELPRNFVTCTKNRCSCVADNKCTTRYKDIQTKERMQPDVMYHIEKELVERWRQKRKKVSILDKYNY